MRGNRTEITKKTLGRAAHHPVPDDPDTSESEEGDSGEENSQSLCTLGEGPEDPVTPCEKQPNGDDGSVKEAAVVSEETSPVPVSEISTMSTSALKNELPVESDSSLLIDVKPFATENLTKNAFNDEETDQRHKESLCTSSFLKISNDKNSIQETEDTSEDRNMPLLSTENKLGAHQIAPEPDAEAKLLSLKDEEKEISECCNSNMHDNVPDNNTEGKGTSRAEENSADTWAFFSIDFPTEELQLGFDTQVSLSWSEDKFVGEQRPPKLRKPAQTQTSSSAQPNCCQSNEGPVKENRQITVTEEAGSVISNGLLVSPADEVHFDSLVEARSAFMQCANELNSAAPITSKRKRYRRIVNLAPKFNLPRQIAGSTEGGKEVPIKDDATQKSVLEEGQKSMVLSKDHGEECEQDHALQECSAPYIGTKATHSLPTPDAGPLLSGISYIHSGQSSSVPEYSCRVCVVSRTKEEQTRTLEQQQVVDKKEDESEQVPSEVTNSQPDILSSVKVVSEYPEDSTMLASCGENVPEGDDPEPAAASQLEDNQDVDIKCSFLGLPLSLGFAFQLVQLFGSPGLPLGNTFLTTLTLSKTDSNPIPHQPQTNQPTPKHSSKKSPKQTKKSYD